MSEVLQIQPGMTRRAETQASRPASAAPSIEGAGFAETLENVQGVRFSSHAQKRLQSRDIHLDSENVNRLSQAIDKAEKRGGKSSLVMVDDLAFIVNVPNRTVVTALGKNQRGEGVFTQIDSVVFADPASQNPRPAIDVKG